jgi:signal transduction histidine kinase
VAVDVAQSRLQIRVSDTGTGITDDQRQHIFEPFYSGREAGRGLGMGLPKAWRIVQSHGGEILVESGQQGTTVTVRLPALAAIDQERACA